MNAKIFDEICKKANFPPLFYVVCKMEGDFLCANISGMFYWINTVTQEFGRCESIYKRYAMAGYRFSNDGHPYKPNTQHRIVVKKLLDICDGILKE